MNLTMADKDYLPELLQNMSETVRRLENKQDNQTKKLEEIVAQTTKTNGRVTALERAVDSMKRRISRFKIKGNHWYEDKALVTAVATIATAIIIGLLQILGLVNIGG